MPLKPQGKGPFQAPPRPPAPPQKTVRPTGHVTTVLSESKKPVKTVEKEFKFDPVTVGEPYATVGAELSVGQSIAYQTIQTRVWVAVPCAPTAEAMLAAHQMAFDYCEAVLGERADMMSGVLRELVAIKQTEEKR